MAEREGKRLAGYVLAHRAAIEGLLKSNKVPGADLGTMAYFVMGCVSLTTPSEVPGGLPAVYDLGVVQRPL